MDYDLAKTIHLTALFFWLGIIPVEIYADRLLLRTRDVRGRQAVLRMSNTLRLHQEFPCIIVALASGVWLWGILGFDRLLQESWFVAKLGCLAYLVFAESYITLSEMRLEKWHRGSQFLTPQLQERSRRLLRNMFVVGGAAMFAGALTPMLVVWHQLPTVGMLIAASLPLSIAAIVEVHDLQILLLGRTVPERSTEARL